MEERRGGEGHSPLRMKAAGPTRTDPRGAPRPLDMQSETESKGSQSSLRLRDTSAVSLSEMGGRPTLRTPWGALQVRRQSRQRRSRGGLAETRCKLSSAAKEATELSPPSRCMMMPSCLTCSEILTISSWGKIVPLRVFSSETMRVGHE
jgi:hypothetical protein